MDTDIQVCQETITLYEARSEDVNEILGTMPSWIIRWGIVITGVLLAIFVFLANVIKFPEELKSDCEVNMKASVITLSMIDTASVQKIRIGQDVKVYLVKHNSNNPLQAIIIDKKSDYVDGIYEVALNLRFDSLSTTRKGGYSKDWYKGNSNIHVGNYSVLDLFLQKFKI